jgi:DNA topoisomerase-2
MSVVLFNCDFDFSGHRSHHSLNISLPYLILIVGSIERVNQTMWVLQNEEVVRKEITYTPGLYKIYDEILVNAADNKQRNPDTMDKLEIEIDPEKNLITVKNNGKGIPIQWHKVENCYVPTLVFSQLLTGSNFDDDEQKTTGGRNGYGAKLANIFSTEFKLECGDTSGNKTFSQTFRDNMKVKEDPIIKDMTAAEKKRGDYVKISFKPDLARFKMDSLDEDTVQLLSKRAYDMAGSLAFIPGKKLSVSLNGTKLKIGKFENYLKLYNGIEAPNAYEVVDNRWEVGVGVSDGTFDQVSFVNSISTSKGGEHVNYIADQVAKKLSEIVAKKNKGGVEIKPAQIKNYMTVFVNCLVDNPSFDSQTKEFLTTKKSKFGSKCELSAAFLKKIEKSEIVTRIITFAKFKEKEKLGKKGGKKVVKLTGIVKLDDANFAGSAKSKDCTLILTEGDSAKSLAMSGISVVGRDYYGVFPLKGKPLNVREASLTQVMKNEEIKSVIDIMGLKFGVVYDEVSVKKLRYGHLMIMADQDHDGSHIKGLVINFIHHYWPSLLNIDGFLQQFITPIVKATKGKQSKTFFTLPEYQTWKDSTGNDAKGWKIKYYKGLGTSTSAEAKEYFSHLDKHEITFCTLSADAVSGAPSHDSDAMDLDDAAPDNTASGSDLIEMAFSKKHVEERKTWLNNLKKDTYLDYSDAQNGGMKYSQFINRELILFSQADNIRSIPNIFDGFKPSQRKVLFGCILRNLKTEMKVAQLTGYIGEKSSYHHGEMSLQGTIVGMAQDFVGSNNINLLTPSGQFGTRRMGGKDSASPRYIFTKLEKITRAIFHPDDDALLTYLNDDGQSIEPQFYVPVIPMLLVNGSDGIGTGWSTTIPNFDPREIIANLRRKINGEEMEEMHPRYFGFNGKIETNPKSVGSYNVAGNIERIDDETILISELPVKMWTQDYKVFLEKMMTGIDTKKTDTKKPAKKDNPEPEISDFKENHTDTTVSFTVTTSKASIDQWEKEKGGLLVKFKLTSKMAISNMNSFDEHNRIIKFDTAKKIIDYFYDFRLDYYIRRKDYMLSNMRREQIILSNKARFIEEVCAGDLVVSNRKRSDILADLKEREYDLFPKKGKSNQEASDNEDDEDEEDDNSSDAELAKGYEYLLGMKIWSLTFEKANKLRQELAERVKAVSDLEATAPTDLWDADLTQIEELMDDRDQYFVEAAEEETRSQSRATKRFGKKTGKKPTKKAAKKPAKKETVSNEVYVDKEVVQTKIVATKKKTKAIPKAPTTKNAVVKKVAPVLCLDDSDDSDDDFGMGLMDRLKANKNTTVASLGSKSTSSKCKKRPSPRARSSSESSEDLSIDIGTFEPAALTPAPKKVRTSKPKTKIAVKSINLDDSDVEMDEGEKPKKKNDTSNKAKKKMVEVDDFSEDDFSDEDEFDEDMLEDSEGGSDGEDSFVPPPRAAGGRSTKRVTYQVDSDSEDEFNFDD